MSAELATTTLALIGWWSVCFAVYCALIFTLDWLLTRYQQRREQRRAFQAELDQIDAQAQQSIQRIGAAFLIAQREIHRQSGREVHRS